MNVSKNELIYLASPYTDQDFALRELRAKQVAKVAGHLIAHGYQIFCPIAHSHYIANYSEVEAASAAGAGYEKTQTHKMWMKLDLTMLEKCDRLFIYMLEGWDTSKGVEEEIQYALANDIPIAYLDYNGKIIKEQR